MNVALDHRALSRRVDWLAAARRFALLLAIVFLTDLAYVSTAAGVASTRLARELEAASAALGELDVDAGGRHAERASSWGSILAGLGSRPSMQVLQAAPLIGGEVGRLDDAASAAAALADETAAMTADLEDVTQGRSLSDRLVDDAGVDLSVLAELGTVFARHGPELRSTAVRLADSAGASAVASVAVGSHAERGALQAATSIDDLRETLRVLPGILGADRQRLYLLVFRSPSEARGGGGLPGVVGTLAARDGHLSISGLTSARRLLDGVRVPRDLIEGEIARTYGRSAVEDWRNVNQSPNFKATARLMLEVYRRASGVAYDGVVSVDPLALAQVAPALGGVRGEGWTVEITRDNARRVLLHDLYRHFDGAESLQNRYLASLVDDVWERALARTTDHSELLSLLADAAAKQHLQVYLRRPREQHLAEGVGAAGASHARPHTQVVFHNNWGGNKVDFFLRREITTTIEPSSGAALTVTTRVALENDVPASVLRRAPTVVTEPTFGSRREVGTNRMVLHVLLPAGARATGAWVDGARTALSLGRDGGREVVSEFVELAPGGRSDVVVRYTWTPPPGATTSLTMVPQPTVRADRYTVELLDKDKRPVKAVRGRTSGQLKTPTTVTWESRQID